MVMGDTAEVVAKRYKISREAQDEYALVSQQRTARGAAGGLLQRRARADAGHARHPRQEDRRDDRRGGRLRRRATSATAPTRRSKAAEAAAGTSTRRAARAPSPPATRRSSPTAPRRRSHVERPRQGARHQAASSSSAASRSPAASPTRWASARSSRCRSCSSAHGLKVDDIDVWELNEAFASQVVYCRDTLGSRWTSSTSTAARSRSAIRSA